MAGTTFMITFISFAIIVGINSETGYWHGYHVTRETSYNSIYKNFTQILNKTEGEITTVDRTVEVTNNRNNFSVSTDHSITTINKGVVTLDRTLETFNIDNVLSLHDHFFNISRGDTVTTGRNCTKWDSNDVNIEYVEVTNGKNHDRTIHVTTESIIQGYDNHSDRICLVYRTDGSIEIYSNETRYSSGELDIIDNSVEFIKNSEHIVDFSETIFISGSIIGITRIAGTFHGQNLINVGSNDTNIDLSTNTRLIVILDDKGGKNITLIIEEVYANGTVFPQSRNAKFDASEECYSTDGTCESEDKAYMLQDAERYIEKATKRFYELRKIEEKAKKEFQDLTERKYNCHQ